MMTLADLQAHVAYNEWANERMFAAVAALSEEQLMRNLGSSFPSVRDTVAHVVGAEWVWLCRWQGTNPAGMPDWSPAATLPLLRGRLSEIEAGRRALLAPLADADLERPVSYTLFSGQADTRPLGALVLHVVNHSTYHRGQVTTMLRQLGASTVSTDLVAYLRTLS